MLPRILTDKERFFNAGALGFGLAQWLLMPTSDEEADVIFDNYLSQEQVDEYSEPVPGDRVGRGEDRRIGGRRCSRSASSRCRSRFWR